MWGISRQIIPELFLSHNMLSALQSHFIHHDLFSILHIANTKRISRSYKIWQISAAKIRNQKSLSGEWLVPFYCRHTDLFSVLPYDSVKFIVRQLVVWLLIELAVMYMLCSNWQTFNFIANGTVAYLNRKISFFFRKIAFHGVDNGVMDAIKLYDFHLVCSVVVFFFLLSQFIFIILSVDIFATLKYAALCLLTVA